MPRIREEEFSNVIEALDDGYKIIHISGQPGVGKSTFLENLEDVLSEPYKTRILYVREGNTPETLTRDLLYEAREAVGTLRALINRATGASVGVGPVGGGLATDDRVRDLRKLASLSEAVSESNRLIFFVDDVHKLGEPDLTRDFLRDLSSTLGGNVHLITAGRVTFDDADLTIQLRTFDLDETAEYLKQEYPDVNDEIIEDIYEKLDGHPYYLGLLREATGHHSTLELPEEDARDFIERAYLDSMSSEEENFIRKTSVLAELDEEICSSILDGVSRTESRRILNSLGEKVVVQELGRSDDTGVRVFKVHDLFQEFLYQQLDESERLHRAAFQYYANKLYDEVKESDAPALEGFVFAVMGSVHLEEIHDGTLEIEQLREEVDQLELEPHERLQLLFGYVPYAPIPDDQSAAWLTLELDDYSHWIRSLEPEDRGHELKIEFFLVMFDLMRAAFRSEADIEFEESAAEIYESTIHRIEDFDYVAFFDEDEQDAAQSIPDLLLVCAHIAAHRDLEDGESDGHHLAAAYEVMEKYGLNRVAVEGFLDKCRNLAEEYDAGERTEDMLEDQIDEFFAQFDQDDVTRNTLIRMQSDLYTEIMEFVNSAFTAMISESDRLMEFVHDCGDSLKQAENPIFVALWYLLSAHVYRMFAPNADSTRELEEVAQHYVNIRTEYEEELENPLYDIEELEIHDLDFPDIVKDIADRDAARQLKE